MDTDSRFLRSLDVEKARPKTICPLCRGFMTAAHNCTKPLDPAREERLLQNALAAFIEAENASKKYPPMNSAHEAFAVLAEEVDELWEIVKQKQRDRILTNMRREALQVAAMALRFAAEVCNEEVGRR